MKPATFNAAGVAFTHLLLTVSLLLLFWCQLPLTVHKGVNQALFYSNLPTEPKTDIVWIVTNTWKCQSVNDLIKRVFCHLGRLYFGMYMLLFLMYQMKTESNATISCDKFWIIGVLNISYIHLYLFPFDTFSPIQNVQYSIIFKTADTTVNSSLKFLCSICM